MYVGRLLGKSTDGSSGTFTLDIAGPPANDDCSTPVHLGTQSGASYDNTLATTGSQGQGGCVAIHKDLWFTWIASQNGAATIDTDFGLNIQDR